MMHIAVFLVGCIAVANAGFYGYYGHPHVYAGHHPYVGSTQYKSQDILGHYNYGYSSSDGISKSESRGVDGSVAGSFAYPSPDGKQIQVSYTAGADGFKATSNALPVPVEDTPEVKEAKAKHLAATVEAAAKAAEPVHVEVPSVYGAPHHYGYGYPYAYAYPHDFHLKKAIYHHGPEAAYSYSFHA